MKEIRNGASYHLWLEGCPRTYRKRLSDVSQEFKIQETAPDVSVNANIDKYSSLGELAQYLETQGSTPVYVQLG